MLPSVEQGTGESVEQRLRRVLALHFDPEDGSPFWIERAAAMKIDPVDRVSGLADLELLGDMEPGDLSGRPLTDYIPRRFHDRLDEFVLGQTGGTTGTSVWTAYRRDEFDEAFIRPFAVASAHVGFPRAQTWLYVGPSGPHVIGKVVHHLAVATGSADPFSVDFDARWAKRLPPESFALARYLQHVVEQAMAVIAERAIGVLFTTPIMLAALADAMTDEQRCRIRGVHYGGMAIDSQQMLWFQTQAFPNAVHLSGYGNTLFGCCLELGVDSGRSLDYFPCGNRLIFDIVDTEGACAQQGQTGRVRFTRLDESMLIVRLLERDQACLIDPPANAPRCFVLPGVRDPGPRKEPATRLSVGLY